MISQYWKMIAARAWRSAVDFMDWGNRRKLLLRSLGGVAVVFILWFSAESAALNRATTVIAILGFSISVFVFIFSWYFVRSPALLYEEQQSLIRSAADNRNQNQSSVVTELQALVNQAQELAGQWSDLNKDTVGDWLENFYMWSRDAKVAVAKWSAAEAFMFDSIGAKGDLNTDQAIMSLNGKLHKLRLITSRVMQARQSE